MDGSVHSKTYTVVVEIDPNTGIAVSERWYHGSQLDRAGGPASIVRHPVTGVTTQEEWYQDGKLGRHENPKLPSIITRDDMTGEVIDVVFFDGGELTHSIEPNEP